MCLEIRFYSVQYRDVPKLGEQSVYIQYYQRFLSKPAPPILKPVQLFSPRQFYIVKPAQILFYVIPKVWVILQLVSGEFFLESLVILYINRLFSQFESNSVYGYIECDLGAYFSLKLQIPILCYSLKNDLNYLIKTFWGTNFDLCRFFFSNYCHNSSLYAFPNQF